MTALAHTAPGDQRSSGEQDQPTAFTDARAELAGPYPYDDIILLADILDDMEKVRVANQLRYNTLVNPEWGKGIPGAELTFINGSIKGLKKLENEVTKELQRAVRKSPLGPFVKSTRGLGEKTVGRLVGAIGDPAWHYRDSRPRTLRELNAYCGMHVWERPNVGMTAIVSSASPTTSQGGSRNVLDAKPSMASPGTFAPAHSHGGTTQASAGGGESSEGGDAQPAHDTANTGFGVAPHRIKGQRANWSPQARTQLWQVAEAMVKNRSSKYRPVYDAARLKYADAVHAVPCKRCTGRGKPPAEVGTPLTDAHKHARGQRAVMKVFLKDLWRASREVA